MAERSILVRLRADVSQYSRAMRDAAADTDRMAERGEQLQRTGAHMTRRITMPLVGLAGAAAAVGAGFQQSMNRVQAVSGATAGEFAALRDQAQDLGATTQFSASQAAEGMGFLAMTGFEAVQILDAMPGVLDLAAASQMDLGRAADLASNLLQQFNLDASEMGRVGDVLVATSTRANTTVEQLGQAMSFVGPVAAGLGVELEETAAAIGLMGDAGIQGGRAGTSLRMALTQLVNATGPAADTLERLGINATDAEGNLRPLDEIVQQLEDSGATAADMMTIFGQRAGPAMVALVGQGSDALRDLTGELRESGGEAARVADVQMQGLTGALRELRSALEAAGIAVFDAGLGDGLESAARSGAELFRSLADTNPELLRAAVLFGGLAAASGPAIHGIGMLMRLYAPMGKVVGAGAQAVAGWNDAAFAARQQAGSWGAVLRTGLTPALVGKTAAIGIAALAVYELVQGYRDGRQSAEEMAAEIRAAADTTEEANERMAETARTLTREREQERGLLRSLLPPLGLLRERTENLVASYDLWRRSTAGATAELMHQVEITEEAERAAEGFTGSMARLEHEQLGAADATGHLSAEQVELLQAAGLSEDQIGSLADETGDYGDEAERAASMTERLTEAISEQADTLRAQTDPLFAAHKATEDLRQAAQNYHEVIADAEATEQDRIEAVNDLVRAERDHELAILDLAEAELEHGQLLERMDELVRQVAEAHGIADEDARRYLEGLGLLDERARDVIMSERERLEAMQEAAEEGRERARQLGELAEAAGGYADQLLRIPSRVETTIVTTNVQHHVTGFGDASQAFSGAGIRTMHSGGMVKRYHGGGGPGLRRDEVPAILQTGEMVLSRAQVAAMQRGSTTNIDRSQASTTQFNIGEVRAHDYEDFRRKLADEQRELALAGG